MRKQEWGIEAKRGAGDLEEKRNMGIALFNEAVDKNNEAEKLKDLQNAAVYFLKNSYNVGIEYEELQKILLVIVYLIFYR